MLTMNEFRPFGRLQPQSRTSELEWADETQINRTCMYDRFGDDGDRPCAEQAGSGGVGSRDASPGDATDEGVSKGVAGEIRFVAGVAHAAREPGRRRHGAGKSLSAAAGEGGPVSGSARRY